MNRRSVLRLLGFSPAVVVLPQLGESREHAYYEHRGLARPGGQSFKERPASSWTLTFEELAGLQDYPLTRVREQNAALGATALAERTESERHEIVTVRSALPCATIDEAVLIVHGWLDAIGRGDKSRKCLTKIDVDIDRIPTHKPGTFRLLWGREQRTEWESEHSDTPSRIDLLTYVNGINATVLSIVQRADTIPVWQLLKDYSTLQEARSAFDAIYQYGRYIRGSLRIQAAGGSIEAAGLE